MTVCTPWADVGDVCAPCNAYDFDTDALEDWLQVASDVLYELTRRRWSGECSGLIRPCARQVCPCAPDRCSCRWLSQLDLHPHGQITSVDLVTIDGATVPAERYRLDEARWLVYIPDPDDPTGRRGWPVHQRLELPTTDQHTWAVAYTYGLAPPLGGVKAAAELACQLALSCSPDTTMAARCKLPKAVTNVSRQGLTFAKANPAALYPGGVTGLAVVDLWVASVNRGAATRPATMFAPGQLPTHRRMPAEP